MEVTRWIRRRLKKLGKKAKKSSLSEEKKRITKSLLNLLQKHADASVEAFKDKMGSLTWFLPISKNRNLETVQLILGGLGSGSIPLMSYQVL